MKLNFLHRKIISIFQLTCFTFQTNNFANNYIRHSNIAVMHNSFNTSETKTSLTIDCFT